jgi:hypothetical protein
MRRTFTVPLIALSLLTGCASYHAPGGPANLREVAAITPAAQKAGTPDDIQSSFEKKPLANFPANVAVVRLQAPGYRSQTAEGWGGGAYSVVLTRDIEPADAVGRIAKFPLVRGVAPIGRMLLPSNFTGDRELRQAAARLQADMLLVYTLDTSFHDRDLAAPISVVTLGLSPTKTTNVVTTASAVLMDTRNGFVYGVAEASAKRDGMASAWTTESAIDGDRRKTEAEAFEKLVGELETMWKGVATEFGPGAPRGSGRYPAGE